MTRRTFDRVRLFMTSTLMVILLFGTSRADDRGSAESFRIRAAAFAPIGKTFSLGEIWINGIAVSGEHTIWPGDLIEARVAGGSNLTLDAIGEIALMPGTAVRLYTVAATTNDQTGSQLLIVSLVQGALSAKLHDGKIVRVEAAGSQFISSKGARFRIDLCDGRPVLNVTRGSVSMDSILQREWIVVPVDADPITGRPKSNSPFAMKKVARDRKRIYYFQVRRRDNGTITPVGRGISVTARLATPGVGQVGSQSVTVFTNDYGVAPVTFTAGHNPSSTQIVVAADLPYDGREFIGTIEVVALPPWLLRPRNLAPIGAGTAAAVAIILVANKSKPLRQVPPPIIP